MVLLPLIKGSYIGPYRAIVLPCLFPWAPPAPPRAILRAAPSPHASLQAASKDYTKPQLPQKTIQSRNRLYKAPINYTKPQQTIHSPDRPYKAPKTVYKAPEYYTKPEKDYKNI